MINKLMNVTRTDIKILQGEIMNGPVFRVVYEVHGILRWIYQTFDKSIINKVSKMLQQYGGNWELVYSVYVYDLILEQYNMLIRETFDGRDCNIDEKLREPLGTCTCGHKLNHYDISDDGKGRCLDCFTNILILGYDRNNYAHSKD